MTDTEELHSARWTLRIAILGVLWVILSIGLISISSCQLTVVAPQTLPSYILPALISELRFLPSGGLIATVESGGAYGGGPFVDIYTWDTTYKPTNPAKVTLDFGQLTGRPVTPPRLVSVFATASRAAGPSPSTQSAPVLSYALSDDGSMIAWSWNGVLFAGPFQEPNRFKVPLTSSAPVVALSFFGTDVVGVLHSGGEFRLERISGHDPGLPGTDVLGPWRISGRGPYRVLSNLQAGQGILVTPDRFFQSFPTGPSGSFITISEKGKLALGTNDGKIHFPRPRGLSGEVVLPEARQVQTIAFVDEQKLIASTVGGSLFLVVEGELPTRLTAAPRGIRLLDVKFPRVAMVTPRSIVSAELRRRPVLDEGRRFWVAVTFYVLSLIALSRFMFGDWYKVRTLKRRLASQAAVPSSPEESGIKEEETSGPTQPDDAAEEDRSPEEDRPPSAPEA
jgi:hypothetical protein